MAVKGRSKGLRDWRSNGLAKGSEVLEKK